MRQNLLPNDAIKLSLSSLTIIVKLSNNTIYFKSPQTTIRESDVTLHFLLFRLKLSGTCNAHTKATIILQASRLSIPYQVQFAVFYFVFVSDLFVKILCEREAVFY